MEVFLDSSVNIAAAGSLVGASRLIFEVADHHGWRLLTSQYVINEVSQSIPKLGDQAAAAWQQLLPRLSIVADVLTIPWPTILAPAKDRPVLFTAAAWAEILLTLDRADFQQLLGASFYGMPISTPGDFIRAFGKPRV